VPVNDKASATGAVEVRNEINNLREFLLDCEPELEKKNNHKCPVIEIKLQGVLTNALLDSGSEVTCISEEFYLRNSERLQKCPKLPISKLSVVGATGGRPVSVKSQLYVEMTIENFTEYHTFVIIPKLKRNV
jgi:Retroviral aspartyl protease.